jgi:uncharacterized RDD family membrane protein YckC
MRYAGFWSRLWATFVDVVVLTPPFVLIVWLEGFSRTAAFLLVVPKTLMFPAYSIYCHGRWGQTIGKMAASIRVVSTDGDAISWPQAFLRASVDTVLAVAISATLVVGISRMPTSEWVTLSWTERGARVAQLSPRYEALDWANSVWFWGELVALLFNRRRRALHDFIAGTVVIHVGPRSTFPVLDPDRLGVLPLLDRR